jgi:large repetitive protein
MAFVSNDPAGGITSAAFGAIPAIPGGCTVTGATANATTPATLPCTLANFNVGSDNSTSVNNDSYATGTDPFFKFGTLVNADSDDDLEYIVVEFNALVDNTTTGSNDYGDSLSNTFVPQVNGTSVGVTSAAVVANVSEPCLGTLSGIVCTSNLNKVVQTLPVPADAGGTVAYRITFANATGANISTAFDTRVLDTLPASLQLNLGSVIVTLGAGAAGPTNASAGNTVDVTIATIPPGGTVQIDYTATILDAALAGDTVDNTANFTYTSLPGAGTPNGQPGNSTGSTTPGASGATNGERDGSGTAPNDYRGADPAALDLGVPAVDKVAPSPASYTIGEIVTYNILVTLPEGTTQNLVVFDDLPIGLQYVAGSLQVIQLAAGSSGLLTADFNGTLPAYTLATPGGSGGDVTVTFSSNATTVGDNLTTNNTFLVRLQALVLNVLSNQDGTVLTNNASLRYTDPETGVTTIPDPTPPTITVVEPRIATTKTVSPATAVESGTVLNYTVTFANTGASTAYDVTAQDMLAQGVTFTALVDCKLDGTVVSSTATPAGNVVTFERKPGGDLGHPGGEGDRVQVHGDGAEQPVRGRWAHQHGGCGLEQPGWDGGGRTDLRRHHAWLYGRWHAGHGDGDFHGGRADVCQDGWRHDEGGDRKCNPLCADDHQPAGDNPRADGDGCVAKGTDLQWRRRSERRYLAGADIQRGYAQQRHCARDADVGLRRCGGDDQPRADHVQRDGGERQQQPERGRIEQHGEAGSQQRGRRRPTDSQCGG